MFAVLSSARKRLARMWMLFAAITLAACMDVTTGGGPSIDTSRPVPIALLLPKSSEQAGGVARALENAARLAVSELGDVKIDLRVYDTAGTAAQAAQVATMAVNDGAKIIIGPLYAEAAVAASKAVASRGVNVLAFSNNDTIAGGNLFILGATFQNTANRLVGYASRQGKRSALIVHPMNDEGEFGKRAIQAAAAGRSMTIASVQSFEFSQSGVIGAIPRIRDAVRSTGADTVFLTSTSAGALPLLVQLLPEAGVTAATTQFAGLARWDDARLLELPGAQGAWFTLPDTSATDAFNTRYAAAYGGAPHPLAGLAFDGIAAIGALVKQGKSDALTAAALTQGAGFQGVNGVFRLHADGTNERALAVATVQDRKVVILEPAPRSFTGAGF